MSITFMPNRCLQNTDQCMKKNTFTITDHDPQIDQENHLHDIKGRFTPKTSILNGSGLVTFTRAALRSQSIILSCEVACMYMSMYGGW